jgi:hypothetical protein
MEALMSQLAGSATNNAVTAPHGAVAEISLPRGPERSRLKKVFE